MGFSVVVVYSRQLFHVIELLLQKSDCDVTHELQEVAALGTVFCKDGHIHKNIGY